MIPESPTVVNPSSSSWLEAFTAIDADYVRQRAALKARFPGRPSHWPAEAHQEAADIEDRYEVALVALDRSDI